jgi:hypothetical protein
VLSILSLCRVKEMLEAESLTARTALSYIAEEEKLVKDIEKAIATERPQ